MNDPKQTNPINWRKFFWVGLVLLVVAYTYYSPTLEKWTGLDLPSLMEPEPNREADPDVASEVELHSPSSVDSNKRSSKNAAADFPELKKIGRKQLESPAGLIYAMGPNREHRVDHIMRHAQDDPSRKVHSVFAGDKNSILKLIDEAYELIRSDSPRVESSREGDRMEYTINMRKKIGYEGGIKGKQNNFPSLRRLKLVLQNKNFVVTAYPYR